MIICYAKYSRSYTKTSQTFLCNVLYTYTLSYVRAPCGFLGGGVLWCTEGLDEVMGGRGGLGGCGLVTAVTCPSSEILE